MSYYDKNIGWIRCALNYGREHVDYFCRQASPYQTVIDLGAGPGADLMTARSAGSPADLYAVELNPNSVRQLEQLGVTVFTLNLECDPIPLEDGSVDLVIANQVLEHLKDIYWVFHEVSRLLPVGGKMIIGVPNLASLHNRILLAFGQQPTSLKINSAHVRGFTRRDFLLFLNEVFPGGYALRGFRGANFYPFPPFIARPLARLLPSMAWGMFLLVEKRRAYHREFLDAPVLQQLETNYFTGGYEDRARTRLPL
jgi:SAM-dependent methyltransferase